MNPTFSGNFQNFMLNQLNEHIILNSLVPKGRNFRVNVESSPLFPELSDLLETIEK